MTGYRLCTVKTAAHPFYVESVDLNLYTVEELCYFLYKNPYLIDEHLASAELVRWIAEDLGLGETALKMDMALRKDEALSEFILPLFQDTRYLEPVETRAFQRVLDSLSSGPMWVRLKKKADALAQNGCLGEALHIYFEAMDSISEQPDSDTVLDFRAAVYYQIGVVNMHLFEYEDGCDSFLSACQTVQDEEHLKTYLTAYLTALMLTKPSEKFDAETDELLTDGTFGIDDDLLLQVMERVEEVRTQAPPAVTDAGQTLRSIVREYHSAAGG